MLLASFSHGRGSKPMAAVSTKDICGGQLRYQGVRAGAVGSDKALSKSSIRESLSLPMRV